MRRSSSKFRAPAVCGLPDGSIMRIGYASQNGRKYVAIGKVLIDQGKLPKGGASMDAILGWLRSHPAEAPAILAANPSVVFFRELTGEGPVGAMGVAVTPNVSVAADPAFIPLGAPLLVETTLPGGAPLAALMVAQDTGGAIKGANRIDLFRGSGDKARAEAGAQAAKARIVAAAAQDGRLMRRLSAQERALWSRVAATVRPLHGKHLAHAARASGAGASQTSAAGTAFTSP